jgi:hypothetical protein
MILTDYINYFRHQATTHPLLLHSDVLGQRVFEVVEFNAAWEAFRTSVKEKDFVMRLALPTGATDGEVDSQLEMYGAFLIARFWAVRDADADECTRALAESLEIASQIVSKMMADSRAGHPMFEYGSNTAAALDARFTPRMWTGDANYAGYWVTFKIRNIWNTCADAAPLWTDGGLTPFVP